MESLKVKKTQCESHCGGTGISRRLFSCLGADAVAVVGAVAAVVDGDAFAIESSGSFGGLAGITSFSGRCQTYGGSTSGVTTV